MCLVSSLCVCVPCVVSLPFVALTFESLDPESLFLVCSRYISEYLGQFVCQVHRIMSSVSLADKVV